ncbi:MAG TPA: PLP-dependent aminotransferase family protein [Mycobacteriales bacterium]|nr:PLP-dependent aminotransferase family protein [Mycobacteriales bacterium]
MTGNTLDPYSDRYAVGTRGMSVSEIRALFAVANRPEIVSLAGGMPNTAALPMDAVAEMLGELIGKDGARALQYGPGQGDPRLRERICEVMALEGVQGSAEDITVTVGSQQALDLVSRLFIDPGDVVLAEGPSYVGALGAFEAAQAQVRHVPLDSDGLVPEALREALLRLRGEGRRAKFLYTVPNYHNPAGVTLTEPRRREIVALCEEFDVLIIEDNPYGLLGFDGQTQPALHSMAPDRVIYLGSFSKTFSAGVRVGWALAPPAVRQKLVLLSEAEVLCPPNLTQFAVAEYLDTQPWREQIKVFRELYRERRDTTLSALDALMPEGCTWTHPDGGFYVWLTLPEGLDSKLMQPRAIQSRVAYVPGIGFYADGNGRRDMRLSYCFPSPERIREGVRRLAGVIEEELELRETFHPADRPTEPAMSHGRHSGDAPGPEVS